MTALLGVDNLLLDVGDLEWARHHYARLGLVERFAFPGMAGFAIGAERPGLIVREVPGLRPNTAPTGPHLWIEIGDAAARALELGLSDVKQVRTGFVFEVTDRWGNTLGFTDYALDPARARPA